MVNPSTAPIPLDLRPFDVAMSRDGRTLYACSGDEAGCVFVLDTETHTVRKKIDCPDATDMLLAPDGSRLYVTNREGRAVTVIDTSDNEVTGSLAMPGVPFDLAALSTGELIYAAVSDPSEVAVIHTESGAVIRRFPLGESIFGLAVSPDDARLYVTDFGGGVDPVLHVVRTATETVEGTPIPVGLVPRAAAVTPDGGRIFVVNGQDGTLSVVDAGSRTVISTIRVGEFPKHLLMDREGRRLYVGNAADNTVSVIDVGTLQVARTLLVDGPPGNLAATPDGHRVYAAGFRERFVVPFDTRTVALRAGKRPEAVTLTRDGRLCVTNPGDGTVSVVRTRPPSVRVGEDPLAVALDGARAYVANGSSDDVSVIDTATDEVTATVPSVPVGPAGIVALAPDGRRLYVAGAGQVSAIDTATREPAGAVPFQEPTGVAVSPDGLRLYVTDGTVGLVALNTDTLGAVGSPVPLGDGPAGAVDVAVTPDGKHVYVADATANRVMVLDSGNRALTASVPLGALPTFIAMSPVGRRAYIACTHMDRSADSVVVVDTNSHTVVGDPTPFPFVIQDLAVSPDGQRLYCTSFFGHAVVVVDTATRARLETIPAGTDPSCLALTPDGRRAYVASRDTGLVTVVDTNTTRVRVGGDPFDLAATSDGRLVYVTIPASGTVAVVDTVAGAAAGPPVSVGGGARSLALTGDDATLYVAGPGAVTVVDTATRTVAGTIPVGDFPQGLALAPDDSRLYVADSAAGTVTVIDTATAAATATVTAGVAPLDVAVTSDGARLFVADAGANDVLVLDTDPLAVAASVPLSGSPHGLALSRDGRTLLVTIPSTKRLAEIDTATLTVRGVPVPVGSAPHGVALSPDGSRAYVANAASDTVSVVDL
ncbi:hypothetical protein [Streptomyces sp. NPDC047928]|uniref:YVTN family beta-propeller repeat protein n=1 Tax=unclassified Streptomyces TaxID=2593676 RepID=UPI0037159E37